jgi:hypothetical protein
VSSATVLNDVAVAAAGVLAGISGLKVYSYDPKAIDLAPAATIFGPTEVIRRDPEAVESQLGSNDWHLTYSLRLFSKFDDPETATVDARTLLGQAIAAIDGSAYLGLPGVVLDAVVARATFSLPGREEAPVAVWDCDLHVWALVT